MNPKPTTQIPLTAEQQAQLRQATGKAVHSLQPQPLEERLAPAIRLQN
jgi:hypothetical protein